MALGNPSPRKTPLGVFRMLIALVTAAVIGAAAGVIWQSVDWFDEAPEEEVLVQAEET